MVDGDSGKDKREGSQKGISIRFPMVASHVHMTVEVGGKRLELEKAFLLPYSEFTAFDTFSLSILGGLSLFDTSTPEGLK
ncbi:unnamed protein product [Allacma fusca]|uniref:Uncharacterized protein n=1 Tax=Allacma fusca TaxID=39272 RepID=A0A8J2JAH1_9HEXA|nr:unnamed protein product [Allacma fusca]